MPRRRNSSLAALRDEWNALVPIAQAAGIPNVRTWQRPQTSHEGTARLEWLRGRLEALGIPTSPRTAYRPPAPAPAPARPLDSTALTPPPVPEPPLPRVALDRPLPDYTFGVEFEYVRPLDAHHIPRLSNSDIARLLNDAGITARFESYNHDTRRHWKITTDQSVGANGGELVSPVLRGLAGIEDMRRACQVLVNAGCTISSTCGFHVHVGVAHEHLLFFKRLLRLYGHYENSIDGIMAPSRRGDRNNYCHAIGWHEGLDHYRTRDTLLRGYRNNNRFGKINFKAFWRQGTVEFRQHGGTIEPDKAEMWVRLCLRMCELAKQGWTPPSDASLASLLRDVQATPRERDYFTMRERHFGVNRPAVTPPPPAQRPLAEQLAGSNIERAPRIEEAVGIDANGQPINRLVRPGETVQEGFERLIGRQAEDRSTFVQPHIRRSTGGLEHMVQGHVRHVPTNPGPIVPMSAEILRDIEPDARARLEELGRFESLERDT